MLMLKADLEADISDALVINLNQEILKNCVYCLEKSHLRGMDAIHLASAVHSDCDNEYYGDADSITWS
jgi:hypothetical protein